MPVQANRTLGRRAFLGTVAGGVAAAGLGQETARRRPNVIYAFSDEHRCQSMSFTEMPEVRTPHMARLAEQGVAFVNCISNYPVCSPHRAMLMTGRWPYQQGIIDNSIGLKSSEMTVAKAFKGAGYRTGYIGKWHLGGTRAEAFGFDHSLIWTGTNAHWDTSKYHPKDGAPVQPKGYNATLMTDQALEYVEAHAHDPEPFFLMISWNPPHSNFTDPPEPKKALYPDGSLPYRPNVMPPESAGGDAPIWDQNDWTHYRGYHAHVSAIDDELGRLVAKLDALGLADDTILVYSADHGSMLGSHGVGGKRQPFEESIRVPFLVRWPGVVPAGARPEALFATIDIMPTLCGLADVPIPESCAGIDFSPALRGKRGPEPESQFIMHLSKKNASGGENHPAPLFRGVRTPRYTYAVYPDGPWCLFDNREDPYQLRNLIDDPDYAALGKQLEAMLDAWLVKAADPMRVRAAG